PRKFSSASAMMLRAELPVQRKSTIRTAVGSAAPGHRRLPRADEGAGHATLHPRRKSVRVEPALGQKRAGIVHAVNTPRLHVDINEARLVQHGLVLPIVQRSRD